MAQTKLTLLVDSTVFTSTIAGKPITADVAKWPNNALVKIFSYGFQRQFNDGVGGSDTTAEDKIKNGQARMAAFAEGNIRANRGAGVDEVTRIGRLVAEQAYIGDKAKDSDVVKALEALGEEAWNAKMDAILAKHGEKLKPAIDREIAKREAARQANAEAKAVLKAAREGLDMTDL